MRILILMYHMIEKTNKRIEKRYALSPDRFRRQLGYLKRKGYTPISLDDLYEYFLRRTISLPQKPVIITFDDGYMDNYENAYPILKECGFPAAVFIIGGFVGNTNVWMKSEGYPERPMMGWREIEDMKKDGITIGSHTMNHLRLSILKTEDARKEIDGSKKFLEDKLGVPVDHFAYPYGDMNASFRHIVKTAGYKTACSTRSGFNSDGIDLFELRRLEIYGTDSVVSFGIKLIYGTNDGSVFLPAKYYMKRMVERVNR
jgi:peptidoglycan/xylan/chitin deacetylase (PgdA/CDA1 family)